ncbi:MAG: hypothetical protein ABSG59_04980 [Verrucomicrobiota bacterium]|jgi:hypothetical protein
MKTLCVLATTLAASGTLLAADSTPKDDVTSAAQKLAATNNYSWTTTTESSQFSPGPSHGKTEKGGFTYVDFSFNDNTIETVVKGDKGAIKTEDGWKSLEEALKDNGEGGFNPLQFMARRMKDYKAPAAEAQDLAGKTKALAKTDESYSSDLTEDGAKDLLSFRGRRNGGEGPAVSNAKGSVKFWIKDGVLTKYQYKVQGTVTFNGEDRDVDRTTTVEIKDVGTTKVTVPDEAKSKMT